MLCRTTSALQLCAVLEPQNTATSSHRIHLLKRIACYWKVWMPARGRTNPSRTVQEMEATAELPQGGCEAQQPANQSTNERREYQHYIPRFILRNFAHHAETAAGNQGSSKKHRKRRGRQQRDKAEALNILRLQPRVLLEEKSLRREFGTWDMYRDFQRTSEQQHIERRLGQLEGKAALTIQKLRLAQESGQLFGHVTGQEYEELRKFLFIMKYRTSNQYRRFYDRDLDTYNANDREAMLEYMRREGLEKPIEVWHRNIQAILDLKMDARGEWAPRLLGKIYPEDAFWVAHHLQQMYLALCTPQSSDDEFTLTENAYAIHEGPVDYSVDPVTCQQTETNEFLEYHSIAPVSPKLVLVIRNKLIPDLAEDMFPELRRQRQLTREPFEILLQNRAILGNLDPTLLGSFLQTLPLTGPYSLSAPEVEYGSAAGSVFRFPICRLSSDHVQKINAVMLNESHSITTITFGSHGSVRRALEYYLTNTCCEPGAYPLKIVRSPWDPMRSYLRRVEEAARLFDSQATSRFNVDPDGYGRPLHQFLEILRRDSPEEALAYERILEQRLSRYDEGDPTQNAFPTEGEACPDADASVEETCQKQLAELKRSSSAEGSVPDLIQTNFEDSVRSQEVMKRPGNADGATAPETATRDPREGFKKLMIVNLVLGSILMGAAILVARLCIALIELLNQTSLLAYEAMSAFEWRNATSFWA